MTPIELTLRIVAATACFFTAMKFRWHLPVDERAKRLASLAGVNVTLTWPAGTWAVRLAAIMAGSIVLGS